MLMDFQFPELVDTLITIWSSAGGGGMQSTPQPIMLATFQAVGNDNQFTEAEET